MGPYEIQTAAQADAENERWLAAAKEAFPGWDFHKVFGGWEAVPTGTPVIRSMDLDGIITRLRECEAG